MTTPDNSPRQTDAGAFAAPLPVDVAEQLSALQAENTKLRTQLLATQQLAFAPRQETSMLVERRWLGRVIQVAILLVGVALGVLYVRVSNDDVARGMRDAWRESARP